MIGLRSESCRDQSALRMGLPVVRVLVIGLLALSTTSGPGSNAAGVSAGGIRVVHGRRSAGRRLMVSIAEAPLPPSSGPPAAPTGLSVQVPSPQEVDLAWTDNSSDEQAFAIWRMDSSTDWARIGIVGPNGTTYVDLTVKPGTTYTYKVRAINGSEASDWSNQVIVTPGSPPAAPSGLAAGQILGQQVTLTWTVNSADATAFAIWRRGGGQGWARVGIAGPQAATYTDATVSSNTAYTYEVRAVNRFGASGWTNSVAVTTPIILNPGDQVQIGGQLYAIAPGSTPALVRSPASPAPVPIPAPAAGGSAPQVFAYVDDAGMPLSVFKPGQKVALLGTGFGSVPGTLNFNGLLQESLSWSDTRIELIVPGNGPPASWFTVTTSTGAYVSSAAPPVTVP